MLLLASEIFILNNPSSVSSAVSWGQRPRQSPRPALLAVQGAAPCLAGRTGHGPGACAKGSAAGNRSRITAPPSVRLSEGHHRSALRGRHAQVSGSREGALPHWPERAGGKGWKAGVGGVCRGRRNTLNAKVTIQPQEPFDVSFSRSRTLSRSCLPVLSERDLLGPFSDR